MAFEDYKVRMAANRKAFEVVEGAGGAAFLDGRTLDRYDVYTESPFVNPQAKVAATLSMDEFNDIGLGLRKWPPNDTTLMTSADWVH